jgi:hypothetical protein
MKAPKSAHRAIEAFARELPENAAKLERMPRLHALRFRVELVRLLDALLTEVSEVSDTEPDGRL